MRTLFSYVGSKRKWMPRWVPQFPVHTLYTSVFGGGGSDILFKPPSELEVFNDIDGDINNIFRVLRHQEDELIHLVKNTPAKSRQTFCEAIDVLQDKDDTPVRRAWAFLVVAHQSMRMSHPKLNRESEYAAIKVDCSCIPQWLTLPDTIRVVTDRFKSVQLENLDVRKVIPKYDQATTFFFIDPPYHPDSRSELQYQHEMTEQDHSDLLELLVGAKGKVWLCGYDCGLYSDELKHWRKRTYKSRTPHANWSERVEVVWRNFVPVNS